MTIGPGIPLPPAMTPGAETAVGTPGAAGTFGGRAVSAGTDPHGAAYGEIRRSVAEGLDRPQASVMSSVREALGLAGAAVDKAVEADCATRNDALGRLFRQTFNCPAPVIAVGK